MNYYDIKSEIDTDPENLGYKDINGVRKSTATILSIGNTVNTKYTVRTPNGKTPIFVILNYLAGLTSGTLAKIADAETNTELPAQIRSICIAFNTWLKGASVEGNFDLDSIPVVGAIGAFKSIGAITDEEIVGLNALANIPVSRFTYLFGTNLSEDDINRSN